MYSIEQGDEYKSERTGQIYEVKYQNRDIVLIFDGENHRLESREHFEDCIESGFWEPQGFVTEERETESVQEPQNEPQEIPYEEISWVGEKGAESLRGSGFSTVDDIQRASDELLLDCNSVGETAVENIRNWVKENE